jgi:hypothetical protein
MFRIHFDPKTGMFLLQVKGHGFFWRTVMASKTPARFKSYDDVMNHVKEIGLNKLYRDGSANKFMQYLYGEEAVEIVTMNGINDENAIEVQR